MLITESQLNVASDSMSLLENMTYLSESESTYYPAMVPVVENSRLGAHMIALEDLCQFAESNGIFDLGAALQSVCESSQISPSTVAFSVHEENVIADDSMADLVTGIMNEGIAVVAMPISENAPEYVCAEMAVDAAAYGDTSLLEAYANDDWEYFIETVNTSKPTADTINSLLIKADPATGKERQSRHADLRSAFSSGSNNIVAATPRSAFDKRTEDEKVANSMGYSLAKDQNKSGLKTADQLIAEKKNPARNEYLAQKKAQLAAKKADAEKQGQSIWQSAKNAATKGRKAIADKIASLNAIMKKWEAAKNAENAGFVAKLKGIVGKVIAWLTQKLHNAARTSDQAAI